uniref:Uncharacterized protein n=1 Tax=Solanum tuberosum TaxID=4113 RepID=M1DIR8_SOLTU
MQHNMEHFLSSELGHSPKRSVKLLGREQRSDFHHNQTTPLSEGMWVIFGFVDFSFRSKKFGIYRKQLSSLSDNAPRALEIMSVSPVAAPTQQNETQIAIQSSKLTRNRQSKSVNDICLTSLSVGTNRNNKGKHASVPYPLPEWDETSDKRMFGRFGERN